MLEIPHVMVAAAIATKIPNPAVSLPLALASHFLIDAIPHWNPHLNKEVEKYGKPTTKSTVVVIADSSLALLGGVVVATQALPNLFHFLTILLACFISVLPDLVEAPYFFLNLRNNALLKRWIKFQKSIQAKAKAPLGLLTQIITIAASIWWITA